LALDVIVKAVNDAEALAAVADSASLLRAKLEEAHRAELAKVHVEARAREAELQRELENSEYSRRVEGETAAIRRKRTVYELERAVAKRTDSLQRTADGLQERVAMLSAKLAAAEGELADRSAQAGQQSLVISRLQQQLSEGAHERTEMRAALDVVAGQSAQLLALQKGEYVAAPSTHPSSSSMTGNGGGFHIRRRSSSIGASGLDRSVTPPRALHARAGNPLAVTADEQLTPAPPSSTQAYGGATSPQPHHHRRSVSQRPQTFEAAPTSPTDRRPPQFGERRSGAAEGRTGGLSLVVAEDPLGLPPPEVVPHEV
jgi:hypothetical protein